MEPKLFVATKAFIINNGRVLIICESSKYQDGSNKGKYDVVGGRLKPGQNFKESLGREIVEETGLAVKIKSPFFVNEWRPVVRGEEWQIVGVFFECDSDSDLVKLSEDHDDYKWIDPEKFAEYPLIENLKPVFENYILFKNRV